MQVEYTMYGWKIQRVLKKFWLNIVEPKAYLDYQSYQKKIFLEK